MAINANEVMFGVTGAFSKVPDDLIVTTADQDISGVGTINYGVISDDGVSSALNATVNTVRGWQNNMSVRETVTDGSAEWTLTFLQDSKDVLELFYGAPEVDGKIKVNPANLSRGRYVLDVIDPQYAGVGGVRYTRHIFNGQVVSRGEIVYANGEPVGYEVTFRALADENGDHFEHLKGFATIPVEPPA